MRKMAVALTFLMAAAYGFGSDTYGADINRLQSASTIMEQIMSAPDAAIPDKIMDGAKCIAVVPSMLKAGFIFGGNYGKGVATCRTTKGWSAPAFFQMTGGSWGLQAGGQASDLVLIFRTDDGLQHMLQSKFKLGGDASAAAGPVGRDAQAMTDITMRAQVLTYSRARGLFAGISLSGAVVHQDGSDTAAFYKKDVSFWNILSGETPIPQQAESFVNTVEKYAPTHRAAVRPPAMPAAVPANTDAPAEATPAAPQPTSAPDAAPAGSTPSAKGGN